MRPSLTVQIDPEEHPFAKVPCPWIWDLVEYFSIHRHNVHYHFERECFTVTFLGHDAHAAQQILDDWTSAQLAAC